LTQKTKPIKKKKNKGPGSLIDTENKTHQKKKKKYGPNSLKDTKNKTHQKKKKKGPASLTDTKNKTHQKKKKGPVSLTDTKNKTHKKKKKKVCAGPGNAWKLPGQTDIQTNRHVTLIYKIPSDIEFEFLLYYKN
jgi:hypothetical protein